MDHTGRYSVQERFAEWGRGGQKRLAASTAAVVGLGALGGNSASILARAGVGGLVLIDADRVSLGNLHRQPLYDEDDAEKSRLKVEAAARRLKAANSQVNIKAHAVFLGPENGARLLAGADVVLDGLDEPKARYHVNQACLGLGVPWVHAGVVASRGQLLVVRPGKGPCFNCWMPHIGSPARNVETDGVIGPLPACLASMQAAEALKLLLGREGRVLKGMLTVDLWRSRFHLTRPPAEPPRPCPVCGWPASNPPGPAANTPEA